MTISSDRQLAGAIMKGDRLLLSGLAPDVGYYFVLRGRVRKSCVMDIACNTFGIVWAWMQDKNPHRFVVHTTPCRRRAMRNAMRNAIGCPMQYRSSRRDWPSPLSQARLPRRSGEFATKLALLQTTVHWI